MPQIVEVNGVEHEFPDGMPDDQIRTVLMREYAPKATAAQAAVPEPTAREVLTGAGRNAANLAVGFVKGAGSTVRGLGKLAHDYTPLGRVGDAISPQAFANEPAELQPTNREQSVGKGTEQVAEFFIPGQGEAGMLSKLPGAVKYAKALQVARQAVEAGGVTAAQRGEVGKDAGLAATISGGLGAAGAVLAKPAAYAARRLIGSILKPGTASFNFGKDPIAAVLDEGIMAPTRESLTAAVAAARQRVGQAVDGAIAGSPNANNPIIDLPAALQGVRKMSSEAKDVISNATGEALDKFHKGLLERYGERLTPEAATTLKRKLGEAISWSPDAVEQGLNGARSAAYGGLKEGIESAIPEVAAPNARYGNLVQAQRLLDAEGRRTWGRSLADVPSILGISGGGALAHGLPGAGAGLALAQLLKTTGAKTVAAQLLRRFPSLAAEVGIPAAAVEEVTRR